MAKQSAKSKGYRKTPQKKPYLSKKEIIALIAIVVVIALGVVLFNLLYDDGYLTAGEVKDGQIVSYVSTQDKAHYMLLGEANEVDGFRMELSDRSNAANALRTYYYYPEDETVGNIDVMYTSGSQIEASTLLSNLRSQSTATFSETFDTEIQGFPAYVFAYTYSSYTEANDPELNGTADASVAPSAEVSAAPSAEASASASVEATAASETASADAADADEEAAKPDNTYCQNITAYVAFDASHTLAFHIYTSYDNPDSYLPDDQLVDFITPYTSAFTMLQPEASATAQADS